MTDTDATSPNAAGPAGARLEAGVAAHYLLALLRGEEARGLPGVRLTRVKLQRAAADHPLDDVIVDGQNASGASVHLDVQVKRQAQFSPGDAVFRKIMGQVADTLRLGPAAQINRDLAIATSQTSRKIDGPYQDVLTWARAVGEASVFFDRIRQRGSANDDHRRFVDTVIAHLKSEGVDHDDEAVWKLLRRLQILVFDLERDGSVQHALTHEQCLSALAPEAAGQAATLQSVLEVLALEIAATGGDVTREQLLEQLGPHGFQLAGERRYQQARAILAEASDQVLAEIDDRLGEVVLLRPQALEKVNDALDQGRYLEIRGAGGVGKSSILKHLARALGAQSRLIALSPERTETGGWARFRDTLGFAGSARDLLVDLAAAGGGMLLVDGLDNFQPPARALVRDLVHAATQTPGFQVVVTARLSFGIDDEHWIPHSTREALGVAPAVRVDELSDEEIDQLRNAAPTLAPLLADGHPAQAVARNLYRLRRLLAQGPEAAEVRTEVSLASLWWRTGDGPEAGHRARTRILQDLADQLLAGAATLATRDLDSDALDALVRSETLRDLGGERMVFRHDVLRDWALFGRLRERPEALTDAMLNAAPSPSLLRAVELIARDAMEQGTLDTWRDLLERVSRSGRNLAWRRAVLLALVRSEAAMDLLDLAADDLLADEGRLIRDLVRLTSAVDAQTVADLLAEAGQPTTPVMARIVVPSGPSWNRLVLWLLSLNDRLPSRAAPDVVALWSRWVQLTAGRGWASVAILRQFHAWLSLAMDDKDRKAADPLSGFGEGFDKGLYGGVVKTLREHLVAFASAVPDQAADYVRRLRTARYGNEAADDAVLEPGALPMAAPGPLADLTFERLAETGARTRRRDRELWTFLDNQFIPESPSRGPFLGLLQADPAIGLALVRRMVGHAINPEATELERRGLDDDHAAAAADDDNDDDDVVDEILPTGVPDDLLNEDTLRLAIGGQEHLVTDLEHYELSRPLGSHGYAMVSALMALEAWAQDRLDKNEPLGDVINDVLGEGPIQAPFLMIAVDLLLSHWSDEAAELALPLVASPKLLATDFLRQHHDETRYGPLSRGPGLPEPGAPPFTVADLAQRLSRKNSLASMVCLYARGDDDRRQRLERRLAAAVDKLPPETPYGGWGDPTFMGSSMLHMLDQANWSTRLDPKTDRDVAVYHQRVDPERVARAQEAVDRMGLMGAHMALASAVESAEPTPPTQIDFALSIARGEAAASRYDTSYKAGADDAAQTMAAALVLARDLDVERWEEVKSWVRERVREGLAAEERVGGGLRYDVGAMAFVTVVHLLRRAVNRPDLALVLTAAASTHYKAHAGFSAVYGLIETLDERLPVSLLRCAFTARLTSWRHWDTPAEVIDAEKAARAQRNRRAVELELAWLLSGGEEPGWPAFPERRPKPRAGVKLPGAAETLTVIDDEAEDDAGEEDFARPVPIVEEGAAAEWLNVVPDKGLVPRTWHLGLVRAYAHWTFVRNGAGLSRYERIDGNDRGWTDAFFHQMGMAIPQMPDTELTELVLEPMARLPDRSLLAAMPPLLGAVDGVFFSDGGIAEGRAVALRDQLAALVQRAGGWADLRNKETDRVETTLGSAVRILFFGRRGTAGSYLKAPAADRLDPFLQLLARLVADCPNLTVAAAFLDVLEVKPRAAFARPVVEAAKVWLTAFPTSTKFWQDADVGRRVCALLGTIRKGEPEALRPLAQDLDIVLPALVALGVAEAGRLERLVAETSAANGKPA